MSTLRERYEQSKRRWNPQSTARESYRRPDQPETYPERFDRKLPRKNSPIRPLSSSRFAPSLPQQYLMRSTPTATSHRLPQVSEVEPPTKGFILRIGEYFSRNLTHNESQSPQLHSNPNHKKRVWFAEETNDLDTRRIEEERTKRLKISYEEQISSMEDELERRSKEVDHTHVLLEKANAELANKLHEIEESYEVEKRIIEENERAGLKELEKSLRLREEALNVKAAALDQQQRNLDFERMEFERTKREFERAKISLAKIPNAVHNMAKGAARDLEIKHNDKSRPFTFNNVADTLSKRKSLKEYGNDIIQQICHNEGQFDQISKMYSDQKVQPVALKSAMQEASNKEQELEAKYQKAIAQLQMFRVEKQVAMELPEVQKVLTKLNKNFTDVFNSLRLELSSFNNLTFEIDLILASPETAIKKFESGSILQLTLNLINTKKYLLYEMKLVNDLLSQISELTTKLARVDTQSPKKQQRATMLTSTPRYFNQKK